MWASEILITTHRCGSLQAHATWSSFGFFYVQLIFFIKKKNKFKSSGPLFLQILPPISGFPSPDGVAQSFSIPFFFLFSVLFLPVP